MGRLEESEKNYNKAIKLNPNYAEAYNNLGLTKQELGKLETKTCFEKVISIKSDFDNAHYNLGLTLEKLEKFNELKRVMKIQ